MWHAAASSRASMTPTLMDVSMILGLPIDGRPLCMSTDSDGWRAQMQALIGMAPEEVEDKSKQTYCKT